MAFRGRGVSLEPQTYLVDDRKLRVADELAKRGLEPIPIRAEDLGFVGGSSRCATLPVAGDA